MRISIVPTEDVRLLTMLDKRIFNADDAFVPEDFSNYACFLVQADGVPVGSVVLGEHLTVGSGFEEKEPIELGTLYIVSMGVVPEYQGCGIGNFEEAWEIEYAREKGFRKVVTNARQGNR